MDRTLLAPIVGSRAFSAAICGVGVVHLGLRSIGLAGWPCPFLSAFGVPCPGCGLSRAVVKLLVGDFTGALTLHAFAPLAVLGMGLCGVSVLLRPTARTSLAQRLGWIESRSRLSLWVLLALLFYWAARLALDGPRFLSLVA